MPQYCYSNGRETRDVFFPMGEAPERVSFEPHADGSGLRAVPDNDGAWTRDFAAEGKGRKNTAWERPLTSESLAVDPSRVGEAMKLDERLGVQVRYDRLGRPMYHSRSERAKHIAAHGLHDRDGGYHEDRYAKRQQQPSDTSVYDD